MRSSVALPLEYQRCGSPAHRAGSRKHRAAPRRVPREDSDRRREARGGSPRPRARHRRLLSGAAEDTRGGRESHAAGVWLIDDDRRGCDLWMVHLDDAVFTAESPEWRTTTFPRQVMARHLFDTSRDGSRPSIPSRRPAPAGAAAQFHRAGGDEHDCHHAARAERRQPRLGDALRCRDTRVSGTVVALCPDRGHGAAGGIGASITSVSWSSIAIEERRKAILEERNRLARDIHDTLAQGFGRS